MADEALRAKIVEMVQGAKKKLKPGDIAKALAKDGEWDKKDVKEAIKELVNEGQLIYTYFGGSFVELPQKDG